MKAAVVHTFERPPAFTDFPPPEPGPDEVLVRVDAAALSRLARGQASGHHYSSGAVPFVPGADGVGRLANGDRVYFAFPRAPWGAMGEFTAVHRTHVAPLPPGVDALSIAALANPAMSSWAALAHRAGLSPGEGVLINGASGVAGRLAIRIAKLLGAGRVVATARDDAARPELEALGADVVVSLGQSREGIVAQTCQALSQGIDVVLDYLWGEPAQAILQAVMTQARAAAPRRLRFVNIGSLAGTSMPLDAAVLRSSRVELVGSGLGSLPTATLVASVAAFIAAAQRERFAIETVVAPLADVQEHWDSGTGGRVVFTL